VTLLAHGRFRTAPFTSAVFALEDIQHAFESLPDRPGDLKTQIRLAG
jgi:L-iditol 2-dehydrogenase